MTSLKHPVKWNLKPEYFIRKTFNSYYKMCVTVFFILQMIVLQDTQASGITILSYGRYKKRHRLHEFETTSKFTICKSQLLESSIVLMFNFAEKATLYSIQKAFLVVF